MFSSSNLIELLAPKPMNLVGKEKLAAASLTIQEQRFMGADMPVD